MLHLQILYYIRSSYNFINFIYQQINIVLLKKRFAI